MFYKQLVTALCGAVAIDSALASPLDQGSRLLSKREVPSTHTLHERQMPLWSRSWEKKERVKRSAILPMRIGLRTPEDKLREGHDRLMDISNPLSPHYGQHMTAHEVVGFFSPPKESVEVVRDWLVDGGIEVTRISQSANKQWIQFDATVAEAEDLLFTDYFYWEHGPTGVENVAADEYHIPAHVQEHIDYITPGIRLRADTGASRRLKSRAENQGKANRNMHAVGKGLKQVRSNANDSQARPDGSTLPPLNRTNCDTWLTRDCIRAQYGIPKGTKAAKGNELGVFESLGTHYSQLDFDVYWSTLYPEIPNGTYPIEKNIDGAYGHTTNNSKAGVEATMDLQVSQSLIWPQRTVLFQTDDEYYQLSTTAPGTPLRGFFNTFFDAIDGSYCTMSAYGQTGNCVLPECLDPEYPNPNPGGYKGELQCGVYEPTKVISISYASDEDRVPSYYFKRMCDEILKLSLQGTTIVTSTSDQGVRSIGSADGCGEDPACKVFAPTSIATCPYVLAVGATQLDKQPTSDPAAPNYTESATAFFGSGGGFSNIFDAPFYQQWHIENYFNSVKLNFTGYTDPGTEYSNVGDGVYRIGGRGYPDVSAIGDATFVIRVRSIWGTAGGTSLSAPIWASILTLINEERIAAGKPTLGFVNPILYAHPEVFTDITKGSNLNLEFSMGFEAAPGWDPVTGLGTPVYPKLRDLLVRC